MIRLGVDAFNLRDDRRGMGRVTRQILQMLREHSLAEPVLIARDRAQALALAQEFSDRAIVPRALNREKLDGVWFPWNAMRFEAAVATIVTVHDPFAFTFPHRSLIARRREQRPIRRALARCNRIIAVSAWTAEQLRRLFALQAPRVQAVPNAIDDFWHPVTASARRPYVLFLGGAEKRKNAALLLHAFEAAFAGGGPQLVVTGTLSAADRRLVAAMRAPVHFLQASDEHLRELYSGAIALALPSLAEGFGMPALEAMACGAPVLACDRTALPETCAGAAVLLPPQAQAWTQALQRICADASLRAGLRERGFERVRRIDPAAPARALIECVRQLRVAAR